ncbi:hypothetical protein E2C01_069629 [Portunus trituberculatus]|uniref:Uncharacterized protein n=1 Tax=Portunus trituberculatus TaxID=210409 RepID=A0A5B7HZW6_PORTR|nr:hypothetical protein [Portunus trituberculatus]
MVLTWPSNLSPRSTSTPSILTSSWSGRAALPKDNFPVVPALATGDQKTTIAHLWSKCHLPACIPLLSHLFLLIDGLSSMAGMGSNLDLFVHRHHTSFLTYGGPGVLSDAGRKHFQERSCHLNGAVTQHLWTDIIRSSDLPAITALRSCSTVATSLPLMLGSNHTPAPAVVGAASHICREEAS